MKQLPMQLTLVDVFSMIKAGSARYGWIYFREKAPPALNTECVLITEDDVDDDCGGAPLTARLAGFVVEGLDTDGIEDCLLWAQQLDPSASPALELESFIYYWIFDAFLPSPGAPAPPSSEIIRLNMDREFYEFLGNENIANPCRIQGCHRGSIQHSVFCRVHHFESIQKRNCPFTD